MKRGAVYLVSQSISSSRDTGAGSAPAVQPLAGTLSAAGDGASAAILRPVVLVSRDAINRHSAVVLVCPLVDAASVQQLYPSDVIVHAPEGGLTTDSVVLTGQLRALARTQLVRYLGELSVEVIRKIDQALRITLDLE